MKTAGRFVVVGWLLLALVLLGMDGQLPVFLAWTAPATLLVLAVGALVRQQRAPSMLDRPQLPEPYRVADDLRQPLCAVVAAAEAEATADGCSRIVGQEPGRQSSVRRRPAAGRLAQLLHRRPGVLGATRQPAGTFASAGLLVGTSRGPLRRHSRVG
jgi:hypothetical protein